MVYDDIAIQMGRTKRAMELPPHGLQGFRMYDQAKMRERTVYLDL